jgi:hypothetical protein
MNNNTNLTGNRLTVKAAAFKSGLWSDILHTIHRRYAETLWTNRSDYSYPVVITCPQREPVGDALLYA